MQQIGKRETERERGEGGRERETDENKKSETQILKCKLSCTEKYIAIC